MPNFEARLTLPSNLRAVSFSGERSAVTVTFNRGADQGPVRASCFTNQDGGTKTTQVVARTRELALYQIGLRADITILREQFGPSKQNQNYPDYIVVAGGKVEEGVEKSRVGLPKPGAVLPDQQPLDKTTQRVRQELIWRPD